MDGKGGESHGIGGDSHLALLICSGICKGLSSGAAALETVRQSPEEQGAVGALQKRFGGNQL
jgi:hypothetical protein